MLVGILMLGAGGLAYAQWPQWAHDPQHNGYVPDLEGQPVSTILWQLQYDHSVPPPPGDLLIHYASPLIDASNNIFMTEREVISGVLHYGIMKLDATGAVLCRYESADDERYKSPPGGGWEPVFHPILANGALYVPGARGVMHVVNVDDCSQITTISFYDIPPDPDIRQQLLNTVFVAGVPAADANGNIFYPAWALSGNPLGLTSQLVEI
jgi:hypothetical protein